MGTHSSASCRQQTPLDRSMLYRRCYCNHGRHSYSCSLRLSKSSTSIPLACRSLSKALSSVRNTQLFTAIGESFQDPASWHVRAAQQRVRAIIASPLRDVAIADISYNYSGLEHQFWKNAKLIISCLLCITVFFAWLTPSSRCQTNAGSAPIK